MPKLRRLGATKTPLADENTTRPSSSISPLLRPLQSGDGAQRRGLAAAARPEQREQLAVRHVERHVLCGFDGMTVGACIFRVQ